MKGKIILVVLIAAAVLSLIPYHTTAAPEWKIHVVDENNVPYQRQRVRQFCRDYSLQTDCEEIESDQYTNENGYVVFPKRTIRLSLLMRAANFAINIFQSIGGHTSFGTVVRVNSTGPQGYQTLEYDADKPLPEKFVLRSKPE
jgi:hypothetical protein